MEPVSVARGPTSAALYSRRLTTVPPVELSRLSKFNQLPLILRPNETSHAKDLPQRLQFLNRLQGSEQHGREKERGAYNGRRWPPPNSSLSDSLSFLSLFLNLSNVAAVERRKLLKCHRTLYTIAHMRRHATVDLPAFASA